MVLRPSSSCEHRWSLNALLLCHACSGQTGSLDVALHRLHRLDAMNRFVVKRDLAPEQEGHCVVRWCCSCSSSDVEKGRVTAVKLKRASLAHSTRTHHLQKPMRAAMRCIISSVSES